MQYVHIWPPVLGQFTPSDERPRVKNGMRVRPFAWLDAVWIAPEDWDPTYKLSRRRSRYDCGVIAKKSQQYTAATLQKWEKPWSEVQEYLEECGYLLRPRYWEGWKPSFGRRLWVNNYREDVIMLLVSA